MRKEVTISRTSRWTTSKPSQRGAESEVITFNCSAIPANSIKGNGTQSQLKKRLAEKGHIKGGATAVKTKTAAAKKPGKKKASTRTRQPARPMTTFDLLDGLSR